MPNCGAVKDPEGWKCSFEEGERHASHSGRDASGTVRTWPNTTDAGLRQMDKKITLGDLVKGAEPARTSRFNQQHRRPSTAPHAFTRYDAPPTSVAAAISVLPRTGTKRRQVYDALLTVGEDGLTDDEMQVALHMNPSTQRPRRIELVQEGFVRDSGRTRPTASGEQAIVWVVANPS